MRTSEPDVSDPPGVTGVAADGVLVPELLSGVDELLGVSGATTSRAALGVLEVGFFGAGVTFAAGCFAGGATDAL